MGWEYVGNIIGPEVLPKGFSHLTGPYGVSVGGVLRVFFTSRKSSGDKFLESVPFFVDLDPKTLRLLTPATQVVYPPADLGSYRLHGVFPLSVFDIGSGALMGLPTGWRRHSGVDVETGIGEWLSLDGGLSWSEFGPGPRYAANSDEPFLVCDGSYLVFQERHFLAYAFGVSWKPDEHNQPQRRYLISVANAGSYGELSAGKAIRSVPLAAPDEVQAFPHLSISNSGLRMFFCYRSEFGFRSEPGSAYKIAVAHSKDGEVWFRDSASIQIEFGEGASAMQCYPTFCRVNGQGLLLFNGDSFGKTGIYGAYERD